MGVSVRLSPLAGYAGQTSNPWEVWAVSSRRVTGIEERRWDGHGHGLTPDKSQMLPFTFCMGSTSLPLANADLGITHIGIDVPIGRAEMRDLKRLPGLRAARRIDGHAPQVEVAVGSP